MTREYLAFLRQFFFDSRSRHKHLELRRLSGIPRYHTATTDILGKRLQIVDTTSFFAMYDEVFVNEIYRFNAETDSPTIIDGGANIGMSSIYFKTLYPNAKVLAFEPDHDVFEVLKKNMDAFGFQDVELHKEALWTDETELSFMSEGSDSGRIVDAAGSGLVRVRAVRTRDLLLDHVDFLKLDIEGAELDVLEDCQDMLGNVDNLFVEYHSFADAPQKIDRLFTILIDSGFRIKATVPSEIKSPLCERGTYLGMDFLMNVFAHR